MSMRCRTLLVFQRGCYTARGETTTTLLWCVVALAAFSLLDDGGGGSVTTAACLLQAAAAAAAADDEEEGAARLLVLLLGSWNHDFLHLSRLLAGTRDTVPEQRLTLFCQFFTRNNSE